MLERTCKLKNSQLNYASLVGNHSRDIVLLHGSCSRWQSFTTILPLLAAHSNVHAVDFRGHGKSSRANSYTMIDHVEDIHFFIKSEIKKPVFIFGNSLGGMVALMIAAHHPNLVNAVILGDSPISMNNLERLLNDQREFANKVINWLHKNELKQLYAQVNDDYFAENLAQCDPAMITELFDPSLSVFNQYQPMNLISKIRCPLLFIRGEYANGSLIQDSDIADAKKILPHLKEIKFENSGHAILQETELVVSVIQDFINNV